jgi:hypothetical protein
MPKELGNRSQGGSAHHKVGCKGMPQVVKVEVFDFRGLQADAKSVLHPAMVSCLGVEYQERRSRGMAVRVSFNGVLVSPDASRSSFLENKTCQGRPASRSETRFLPAHSLSTPFSDGFQAGIAGLN